MKSSHSLCGLLLAIAWMALLHGSRDAEAYRNYTVGDSLGWYDRLEEPDVDYKKWVAGKNFSLGDFLIFNTSRNHSVVQTYNVTTYRRCDVRNAEDDDTMVWSAGPQMLSGDLVSIAVPLVREGMNFFFSGLFAGAQCRHGQHFKINVTHGEGLPAELRKPPPAKAPHPGYGSAVPVPPVPTDFSQPNTVPSGDMASAGDRAAVAGRGGVLAVVLWLVVRGALS